MALGGLAGQNCHCQWGLSGILLGLVVMLAAGVFTALPVYFDLFAYQWYYALCWFWFLLGVAMLVFGIFYECFCISKEAKAREIQGVEENGDGPISAPTPYIMIN
mmetsp:Transcript_121334/g.170588  ORF Transcript_121334/g.170588 Transcript_121334/m.170588 type:complete len:105 (-) Transcript_121334:57-371(-)|eukprot:CAMPEP_0181441894 /NCGR_PEP_ID=MMETSP1110-20121109/23744_1 /TAXON_ID=174948 /ORGANISM="Symbiodinium sp., Strain CCMP421" /LENGTH=104 /DNA_ID=CAMNT_0023565795 /DNA_START=52 /DNA_END=366 /DNA_ORIENTATION=-